MVAHQILVLIVGVRILPGEVFFWSLRLTVRTVDSHSTNRGSIPLGTIGFGKYVVYFPKPTRIFFENSILALIGRPVRPDRQEKMVDGLYAWMSV